MNCCISNSSANQWVCQCSPFATDHQRFDDTHVLDILTGFKTWHAIATYGEHHIPDPWKFVRIELIALLIEGT